MKEIEIIISSLYDEIMDKPRKVLEIFEDYYDEDRVELQGFPDKEEFIKEVITNIIPITITSSYLEDLKKKNKEDSNLIDTFLNDINNKQITKELVTYNLYPIKVKVIESYFKKLYILVYFPKVRVTNEYNKFVDITQLWAKVYINTLGKSLGYFGLNRSEYNSIQFDCNYLHSHMPGISKNNLSHFYSPCLGNGPINNTISTLTIEFNAPIWQLFCFELDSYVKVESLKGGPYKKLEELSRFSNTEKITKLEINHFKSNFIINSNIKPIIADFIKYIIEKNIISFNFKNGSYGIAMSDIDFIILVSNSFIEYINLIKPIINNNIISLSLLKTNNIIQECVIIDNVIYTDLNRLNDSNYTKYIGTYLFTFKGREIKLSINDIESIDKDTPKSLILNPKRIESILVIILQILNFNYNGTTENTTSDSVSTQTRFI